MKSESKKYWDLERKLEDIAGKYGWSIREMLDHHREDLDFQTYSTVSYILKNQADLARTIHSDLTRVAIFPDLIQ